MLKQQRNTEPGFHILQSRYARFHNIISPVPAIIWVLCGVKRISTDRENREVGCGYMVLLPENRPITVENTPDEKSPYEARVLAFDRAIFESVYSRVQVSEDSRRRNFASVSADGDLEAAFERARHAMQFASDLPKSIYQHYCEELVIWLAEKGACLPWAFPASTADRVRSLVASSPSHPWTSAEIGKLLAVSEATLRRRLASEATSFSKVLSDVRMLTALSLIQTTDWRLGEIAAAVGYQSTTRFSNKFLERFGVRPLDLRREQRQTASFHPTI